MLLVIGCCGVVLFWWIASSFSKVSAMLDYCGSLYSVPPTQEEAEDQLHKRLVDFVWAGYITQEEANEVIRGSKIV